MMYLHYLCIFGLHNDPFEDCKQWKLLKHVPLSDLNPSWLGYQLPTSGIIKAKSAWQLSNVGDGELLDIFS